MAETFPQPKSPEHHKAHKSPEHREHIAPKHENSQEHAKKHHEMLVEARESVQELAHENKAREHLHAAEMNATPADSTPQQINRDLQAVTRQQGFNQIRRRLSPVQRTLSKVIHQPAVRAVSEATGKTVSRPSGLLGGGLVAFLGTSTYLYLANHIGFEYNYGVFLLLFVGGFAFGLLLEFVVHFSTGSRRKLD